MAATDITASVVRLKGTNSQTNYKQMDAYIIDAAENAGLLTVATHELVTIPAGRVLTGIKAILIGAATSDGSATAQFKYKVGSETAEAINGTAYAVAAMTAGKVYNLPLQAVSAYSATETANIELVVAVAAFTALKFALFVETIPLDSFLTK